jgi:peptide/nickel transport system permease protein
MLTMTSARSDGDPSLIGVVIVTFLLTRALPGDPAAYFAGPAATQQATEEVRVNLGLDKPLIVQSADMSTISSTGNLGISPTETAGCSRAA